MKIDFLKTRRSTPVKNIGGNAPTGAQIEEMLGIASRVPDHNKLAP